MKLSLVLKMMHARLEEEEGGWSGREGEGGSKYLSGS